MKVDLLLKNGWVYRTGRQSFEKADIAVMGDRFYDISSESGYGADIVTDCTGKYIIPGLIDIHTAIESSMTYPEEFSRQVLPWGVTCVVAKPGGIARVFGVEGIKNFLERETDLDIYYGIPSGILKAFGVEEGDGRILKLLREERIICIEEEAGEAQWPGRLLFLCRSAGHQLKIESSCPDLTGKALAAFIRSGAETDSSLQTGISVLEKTDMGVFVELQMKSLTHEVVKAVTAYGLYENVALVTGGAMPGQQREGSLNRALRLAVMQGMPPEKAIYCATYTPARRMGFTDRGMIAPGKLADFVILEDLSTFCPEAVYKSGKRYEQKKSAAEVHFPKVFYQSVKCRPARSSDFRLEPCPIREGRALVNVMQIQSLESKVKHIKKGVQVRRGQLCWQEAGLCLAALFERYEEMGTVSYGLIENGFASLGAAATTLSYSGYQLLVLGNSVEDMVLAQNRLVRMQGGYVTARNGRVTASAALPVGGILSDKGMEESAKELSAVKGEIEAMGYVNGDVLMSVSALTNLFSPELRLSGKGLYDVSGKKMVPLVEKYF